MMSLNEKHVLTAIDDIRPAAKSVLAMAEAQGSLDEGKRYEIELIVKELLSNSFKHSKPSALTPVVLDAAVEDGSLKISVTDEGEGFEYKELPACALSPMCESGRGLILVRALCREIKFNLKGNSVEVKVAL